SKRCGRTLRELALEGDGGGGVRAGERLGGDRRAGADRVGALAVLREGVALVPLPLRDTQRSEGELQTTQNDDRHQRSEYDDERNGFELHQDLLGVALDARAERDREDSRSERTPHAAERVHAEDVERIIVAEGRLEERAGE